MILEDRLRDLVKAACIDKHYGYTYNNITRQEIEASRPSRYGDIQKHFDLMKNSTLALEIQNKIKVSEPSVYPEGHPWAGRMAWKYSGPDGDEYFVRLGLTREEIASFKGLTNLYVGSVQIPDDVMEAIDDPYVPEDEIHLSNEEVEAIIAQMEDTMTA